MGGLRGSGLLHEPVAYLGWRRRPYIWLGGQGGGQDSFVQSKTSPSVDRHTKQDTKGCAIQYTIRHSKHACVRSKCKYPASSKGLG